MSTDWKTFTCRYYHDGKWWGLEIVALDERDAEDRVRKLGNLQLLGEVKAKIPVGPGSGLLARAIVAVRNWLWR